MKPYHYRVWTKSLNFIYKTDENYILWSNLSAPWRPLGNFRFHNTSLRRDSHKVPDTYIIMRGIAL